MKKIKMDAPGTSNSGSKKDKKGSTPPQKFSSTPRIVTMDSIRSSDDDEKQAFFAGGSEHSGQQILGNGKRRNNDEASDPFAAGEALAAAFRRASSVSGAEPSRVISYYPEPQMFSGVGHRLGDNENSESEIVPGTSTNTSGEEDLTNVAVTLWQDGFSVDDGPLVPYDDKKCTDLKDNVDNGEWTSDVFPHDRRSVHLSVVDKRDKKYEPSIRVFGGKGHLLGSPTPTVSTVDSNEDLLQDIGSPESSDERLNDSLNGETEEEDESVGSSEHDQSYTAEEQSIPAVFSGPGNALDSSSILQNTDSNESLMVLVRGDGSSQAISSSGFSIEGPTNFADTEQHIILKIRLPDGHTFRLAVNVSTTIADIKNYIKTCIPALKNKDFKLHLAYPPRELKDSESINSGDIKRSVLMLKL